MSAAGRGGNGSFQSHENDVLVVGAMRSGTTWVAEVLSRTADTAYLHEPDNPWTVPFAARACAGLGSLPVVDPEGPAPLLYGRIWETAFSRRRQWPLNWAVQRVYSRLSDSDKSAAFESAEGTRSSSLRLATRFGRPVSPGSGSSHRVVKSVFVALSLEWLVARFQPRVLLVRRHPLDVIASLVRLGWGGAPVDERGLAPRVERWQVPGWPADGDRFERQVWLAGFTMSAYDEVADAHPEFRVVEHEALCVQPVAEFRRLVDDVGLEWTDKCGAHLLASERPGDGTKRQRSAAEQAGKWAKLLSSEQIRTARDILAPFPVAQRYPELTA